MRLQCSRCGKAVSSEIPVEDFAVRAFVECPECIAGVSDVNDGPVSQKWYKPLESPRRYPLELDSRLHVNLWAKDGTSKWTIGYFDEGKEGFGFKFLGDRPFDSRVNWEHLREVIAQGQSIAGERFRSGQSA